jgi:hypothetical protein
MPPSLAPDDATAGPPRLLVLGVDADLLRVRMITPRLVVLLVFVVADANLVEPPTAWLQPSHVLDAAKADAVVHAPYVTLVLGQVSESWGQRRHGGARLCCSTRCQSTRRWRWVLPVKSYRRFQTSAFTWGKISIWYMNERLERSRM